MKQGTRCVQIIITIFVSFFLIIPLYSSYKKRGHSFSLRTLLEPEVRVLTTLEPDFEDSLVRPLKETYDRIFAMQYSLSNKAVIAALLEKAEYGVPIEIILDPSALATIRVEEYARTYYLCTDKRSLNKEVKALIQKPGVQVFMYEGEKRGLMHVKTFILEGVNTGDGKKDIVHSGSANCTGAGYNMNCEISQIFTAPEVVARYKKIYQLVKKHSLPIFLGHD